MQITNSHVPDEELLSFADGELRPVREAAVERHLAACWMCRTRRAEIEGAIADFVRHSNQELDGRIPPPTGPRALLKLRLAEAAKAPHERGYLEGLRFAFPQWRMAYLGVAIVLVFLAGVGLWRYRTDAASKHASSMAAVFEPNPSLTPGAVRPVSLTEICGAGASDKNRIVPAGVQRQVFKEYGMTNARPEDYEVDYLITPELGGADDIKNLWPQPFTAKQWSAHTKDDLEDRLHELVCEKKLDLSTAQHDIATDWIGAYKKYLQEDTGVGAHSGSLEKNEGLEMAKLSQMNQPR